jgi:hypothetical protein
MLLSNCSEVVLASLGGAGKQCRWTLELLITNKKYPLQLSIPRPCPEFQIATGTAIAIAL